MAQIGRRDRCNKIVEKPINSMSTVDTLLLLENGTHKNLSERVELCESCTEQLIRWLKEMPAVLAPYK